MQGDPRIIDLLNQVLRKELTGINQYFIHSRMCKNWGYAVLTKVDYEESLGEMKHADKIIERILFLDGVPNLSDYDTILIGQNVKQQIDMDLSLEMAALGPRSACAARKRSMASSKRRFNRFKYPVKGIGAGVAAAGRSGM